MEQRGKELDNWDALVKKAIDSLQTPSILRDMGQRCPPGNHSTYITVAIFQTSATQDS